MPVELHPLALGVPKTKESQFIRVLPGGKLSIVRVLLEPGQSPIHRAVSSLPRSGPRPDVYCPFCGRQGHYSHTEKYRHFSHASGQEECTAHDLESALHFRAKQLLMQEIAAARSERRDITVRVPCVRCNGQFKKKLVQRGGWDTERPEFRMTSGLRPDLLLFSGDAPVVALEVCVTHAVTPEKAAQYLLDGLGGVEIVASEIFDAQGKPVWNRTMPLPLPKTTWGLEVAPRTVNVCSSCRAITNDVRDTATIAAALAKEDPTTWLEIVSGGGFSGPLRAELIEFPADTVMNVTRKPEILRGKGCTPVSPRELSSKLFAGLQARYGEGALTYWSSLAELGLANFEPLVKHMSELFSDVSGNTELLEQTDKSMSGALEIAELVHHATGSSEMIYRSRAWIGYALLRNAHSFGNTCMSEQRLRSWPGKKLRGEVNDTLLAKWLQRLEKDRVVARFDNGRTEVVALHSLAVRERRIVFLLSAITKVRQPRLPIIEAATLSGLNDAQRMAVRTVHSRPITLIHGAAGTGKSRVIAAILQVLPGLSWLLLAPTGKAADRLREITAEHENCGLPITFHRVINDPLDSFQPAEGTQVGVVLDEAGFISVEDFARLLEVLQRYDVVRLVLVGDPMQLPSIGPGRVFFDLIRWARSSRRGVGHVTLVEVMRSNSEIATVANAVRIGRFPTFGETVTIEEPVEVSENFVGQVVQAYTELSAHGFESVQIITKTRADANLLNLALQKQENPNGRALEVAPRLHVGDRVICTENYYGAIPFLNGQQAEIIGENPDFIVLSSENTTIHLPVAEIRRLSLGYALTIHKAQGSEWDCVVVVLPPGRGGGTRRPMIYTALTRGRHRVHVISQGATLSRAIDAELYRQTSLPYFLGKFWK